MYKKYTIQRYKQMNVLINRSGDEVLSVNDIMLQNMPLTTVVSILKDAGSSVCLVSNVMFASFSVI